MNKKDKYTILKMIKDAGNKARNGIGKPFLATVSGVLSTNPSLIEYAANDLGFNLVTTKSYQVSPNEGNREPVICEPELGSFGNSVGLKNVGMDIAFEQLKKLLEKVKLNAILNISLSASSPQDFIVLIKKFENIADMLELNFSCPHASAGFGSSIGCDKNIASAYVKQIKKELPNCPVPIFVKLTPNVDNIGEIAKSIVESGADGLVGINTVGPKIHIEKDCQKPILQNKLGGKGGMSGSWIFERAVDCISEIRNAVGEKIPIIGMGGVFTGKQVCRLIKAGADIVGLGSVCGMVEQEDLKPFFENIAEDAKAFLNGKDQDTSSRFLRKEIALKYQPKTIIEKVYTDKDVILITLDGECEFEAGQFVFLWIPGIGEKPFSLAQSNPLRIIIKKRGAFTQALFNFNIGDKIYLRGLYGRGVKIPGAKKALLIAGGTGIAVLPALAKKLKQQNTEIFTFVGTSGNASESFNKKPNAIEDILISYGKYKSIADDGKTARILDILKKELDDKTFVNFQQNSSIEKSGLKKEIVCYLVGPMIFMETAAKILQDAGINKEDIFMSLEMNTMCGIGICGECACGNILTCKQGTFISC